MRNPNPSLRRCAATLVAGLALAPALPAAALDKARPSDAETQLHDQVINGALTATQRVRAAVEDYHVHHGDFPSDSADIGLNPGSWATQDIKSVSVGANGMIEIRLGASSGVDDGVIRLTPSLDAATSQVRIAWACTSPNYNTIADATSGFCAYSKLP